MRYILRIIGLVLLIAAAAAALTHSCVMMSRYDPWVVDDAFILLRYAENLAEHGELNWNVGEDPVEGYTGIAMVVVTATGIKLSVPPVLMIHVIGVAFYFAGAVLIILILRGFNLGSVAALVLYCTAPFLYTHAWSGLETTMFTSAVLFAIWAYSARRTALIACSLIFLSLVRPEGFLLSAMLILLYRPFSRKALAAWIVPCLAVFVWRWIYYGQLLPNTFYAKSAHPELRMVNVDMLADMAVKYLAWPGLLAMMYIDRDLVRKHWRLIAGTAGFFAACLILYVHSELVMNFSYRFYVPVYVTALVALGGIIRGKRADTRMVVLVVLLVALQAASNTSPDKWNRETAYSSSHYRMLQDVHIEAGRFLREAVPNGEWLVVHSDAGAIPYFSGLRTIDFGRLNDEFLARNIPQRTGRVNIRDLPKRVRERELEITGRGGLTEDDDSRLADYFFSRNPGAIAFTSSSWWNLEHGRESRIISGDERFGEYALVRKYVSNARTDYHQFIYLRKDIISAEGLEELDAVESGEDFEEKLAEASFSPDAIWALSQGDIAPGDRIRCCELIIEKYPGSRKAPEALWMLALEETAPSRRIELLRRLVHYYPGSGPAPRAQFLIGFTYSEDLADTAAAIEAYRETIRAYPESRITGTTETMLEELLKGK